MLTSHNTGSFATTSVPEGFGLEEFEEAGLRAVERRFGPKDTIFTPGDPDDQLYFLLSGTVRLYKIYGDYKEATTALLKDGGVFGKLNLVEGRWQDVFAEAVTEARVASIQKSSIERVIQNDPGFALKLFSSLSERLRQSDEVELAEHATVFEERRRGLLVVAVDLVQAHRAGEQEVELVVGVPRREDRVFRPETPLHGPEPGPLEFFETEPLRSGCGSEPSSAMARKHLIRPL